MLGSRSSSHWVEQRSRGTLLPCMHTDGWIIPRDSEGSPALWCPSPCLASPCSTSRHHKAREHSNAEGPLIQVLRPH